MGHHKAVHPVHRLAPGRGYRPLAERESFQAPVTPTGPVVGPIDPHSIEGLTDRALIQKLKTDCAEHHVLSYDQARADMFTKIDNVNGSVRDVYTGRLVATTGIPSPNEPQAMNTEHTYPQSQLKHEHETDGITDLYNLYPADTEANNVRGDLPFGVVEKPDWQRGGAKRGVDAKGDEVFEPPDGHKGNVARTLFYISTVYDLPLPSDEEAVLKQWNHQDPVDPAEAARNAAISTYQGNRNPFEDEPELADKISDF